MEQLTYLLNIYITYTNQLQEYQNRMNSDKSKAKISTDLGFDVVKNN